MYDEAPMHDRAVFECLDRSLRKLLDETKFFGGIPVIFGGDWQQILPVVVRGARWQIVDRILKKSYL